MNLILLSHEDFVTEQVAVLRGRRKQHVAEVHRVRAGDTVKVGLIGNKTGTAIVARMDDDAIELAVDLHDDPPPSLPLTLVLALPRPKVLNRAIASAASLGIKKIFLINAWRVEKSYWKSPKLSYDNLTLQALLGLEQAKDTIMPEIVTSRFFRRFVEEELPDIAAGSRKLVAHPPAAEACPRNLREPATLVIGPEGGFIEEEIASLVTIGFCPVSIGPRVLRVETAIAALAGRLY